MKTIDKETFLFLKDIKQNNNRDWFAENKDRYESARLKAIHFITSLIQEIAVIDSNIPPFLEGKKCLFRIYRDVRFSKNKDPYKTWFAAGISMNPRKLQGPEYYLHIEPGNNFFGIGYWRPEKDHLHAIRQEIDYNTDEFLTVLENAKLTKKDLEREDSLKRAPKGYEPDHPHIDLIKLKSYLVSFKIDDNLFHEGNALAFIKQKVVEVYPFKAFLERAIS